MEPRVVYVVISHDKPQQVERLVGVLKRASSASGVVIHHDPSMSQLPSSLGAQQGVHVLMDPAPVEWGHFSHVEAIMKCFRWVLTEGQFDWAVLLSGRDYPIRPLLEIERTLTSSEYDAFISAEEVTREKKELFFRYYYHYYGVPQWLVSPGFRRPPLGRALPKLLDVLKSRGVLHVKEVARTRRIRVGIPCSSPPFSSSFKCFWGLDWFSLTRRCIEHIDSFFDTRKTVVNHYRRTFLPSESIFHSILCNERGLRILNDSRRFIRWSKPQHPHPDVLGVADLPELLGSRQDFARKFDMDMDAEVLDELDKHILDRGAL